MSNSKLSHLTGFSKYVPIARGGTLNRARIVRLVMRKLESTIAVAYTAQKHWQQKLTEVDKRAITPLIFSHVNPYGTFKLDLNERIVGLAQQLVA